MGYFLASKNKNFSCKLITFHKVLNFAYLFWWHPSGTKPPTYDHDGYVVIDNSDWDGDYFGNSFQTVTEEDAKEIAVSLQKALQYIPDTYEEETLGELVDEDWFPGREEFNQMVEEEKDQFLSTFIGLDDYLEKFIDFCEDRGFLIS